MTVTDRRAALDQLYALWERIQADCGGRRSLADPQTRTACPPAGVYFFFEPGEQRDDGRTLRVVRVGTHAITGGSQTTLWSRLRTHRGALAGRNPGGGNHRGSVFRRHIGSALIARDGYADACETWGQGASAPRAIRDREQTLERAVSAYIRAMSVLWLPVSARDDRKAIEQGCLALLSNYRRDPIDPPASGWLGHYAASAKVAASGVWNVDHVDESAGPAVLERIQQLVNTAATQASADKAGGSRGFGS